MNRNTTVSQPKIHLLPGPQISLLAELDGRAHSLYLEFCWWHNPSQYEVQLPFHLAWQIEAGLWDRAIEALESRHLIHREVRV